MTSQPIAWREPEDGSGEPHRRFHRSPRVHRVVEVIILLTAVFVVVPVLWTVLRDGGEKPIATNIATDIATNPATTSSTSPVTTPIEETAPLADMSGSDFDHITREFFRFDQWLQSHPAPELVSTIFEPGTPAFTHVANEMQNPTAGSPMTLLDVRAEPTTSLDRMLVFARTTYGNDLTQLQEVLTFVRHSDGTWRVSDHIVREIAPNT